MVHTSAWARSISCSALSLVWSRNGKRSALPSTHALHKSVLRFCLVSTLKWSIPSTALESCSFFIEPNPRWPRRWCIRSWMSPLRLFNCSSWFSRSLILELISLLFLSSSLTYCWKLKNLAVPINCLISQGTVHRSPFLSAVNICSLVNRSYKYAHHRWMWYLIHLLLSFEIHSSNLQPHQGHRELFPFDPLVQFDCSTNISDHSSVVGCE